MIRAVETNTGIISGCLTAFPLFLKESGIKSLGSSSLNLLKSRVFNKSADLKPTGTADALKLSSRKSSSKSGFSLRDRNYVELQDVPKVPSVPRQENQFISTNSTRKDSLNRGIMRRDDYDVTRSTSS